jgi:hypothetical protein
MNDDLLMPPQSSAEKRTNIGLICFPFLFRIYLVIIFKRGTELFIEALNVFSNAFKC